MLSTIYVGYTAAGRLMREYGGPANHRIEK